MWRPCREEQNTAFDRLVLMIDLGDRSQPERRAALLRERGRGGVGVHGEWNSATDKERRRRKTSQFIQLFRIIIRHATVRFAGEIMRRSRRRRRRRPSVTASDCSQSPRERRRRHGARGLPNDTLHGFYTTVSSGDFFMANKNICNFRSTRIKYFL